MNNRNYEKNKNNKNFNSNHKRINKNWINNNNLNNNKIERVINKYYFVISIIIMMINLNYMNVEEEMSCIN